MNAIKYKNPVVPGCYPDPSICRVGEDFYLVTSTFEFFPMVPVLHSRDLVHWRTIGHCISRPGQLELSEGEQSHSGIYAPSIRYHDGIFYMITTNVGKGPMQGNFYVWTRDPAGEWSDPVFLGTPGIDPSLYFEEDGTSWYVGTADDGIYVQEIDLVQGKMLGAPSILWHGTGGCYPEGPHIYKKNGWYYLMISEGGTERCHMLTMARSRSLTADYLPYEHNPVMTNRSLGLPIQSVAHADLVEDSNGDWWAVCLGTRTFSYPPRHNLGRECMLVPVDFSGEWPVFGDKGRVLDEFVVPRLPGMKKDVTTVTVAPDTSTVPVAPDTSTVTVAPDTSTVTVAPDTSAVTVAPDTATPRILPLAKYAALPCINEESTCTYTADFTKDTLDFSWNAIYNPKESFWRTQDGALTLRGNAGKLSDAKRIAWLGRRQQHHDCEATVTLRFDCQNEGEEAGITVFTNNLHYCALALTVIGGKRRLIFRRQIGSLWKNEAEIDYLWDTVTLKLTGNKECYTFYYQKESGAYEKIGSGETIYLTTEAGGAFTGNYIGLYSVGNGAPCEADAVFTGFTYRGMIK